METTIQKLTGPRPPFSPGSSDALEGLGLPRKDYYAGTCCTTANNRWGGQVEFRKDMPILDEELVDGDA